MKLYTSFGPNPAVVAAFLLQRRQVVDTVMLDVMKGESRQEPYVMWNPAGTMPLLRLDDGRHIAESTAICEYLDEVLPGESLIGTSAAERAITRMWLRRVDIMFVQRSADGWRWAEGIDVCRRFMHVVPHAATDYKLLASHALAWIDQNAGSGPYLCGSKITLADILLFVFVEIGEISGQPTDPSLEWIARWRKRLAHEPMADAVKMPSATGL